QLAQHRARFRDVDPTWIAMWVNRLAVLVPWSTCLVKALTLQVLLARRRILVEVVFGVRMKPGKKLDAHAWVEHRGRILLGRVKDMEAYKVLRRETVRRQE